LSFWLTNINELIAMICVTAGEPVEALRRYRSGALGLVRADVLLAKIRPLGYGFAPLASARTKVCFLGGESIRTRSHIKFPP
jgi:hypothetical protein